MYDALNQLTYEYNPAAGKIWWYTYDFGGNILFKTEYSYAGGIESTPLNVINYTYDENNHEWHDLLTGWNNQTITYDGMGNPLSYRGWTMTWQGGRQLAGMTDGTHTLSFDYNEGGLRTTKTVDNTTRSYVWNSSQLLADCGVDDTFYFHYNANGEMIGYTYKTSSGETECFLVKNQQGDVEKVISADGTVLAAYTYDAWGNVLTSTGSLASANPIRYRGYYFDNETGLYYLHSRYYDPQTGRFINADDAAMLGADGDLQSYNLFTYCGNNPVSNKDSNGLFTLSAMAIGAIVGGLVGGVYSALKGNPVEQVIWDTMVGAASGAAGAGNLAWVTCAAVLNGANTFLTSDGDIVEAAWSFGITFATGTIGFGIGSAFKGITGSTFVIGHVVTDLNIGI